MKRTYLLALKPSRSKMPFLRNGSVTDGRRETASESRVVCFIFKMEAQIPLESSQSSTDQKPLYYKHNIGYFHLLLNCIAMLKLVTSLIIHAWGTVEILPPFCLVKLASTQFLSLLSSVASCESLWKAYCQCFPMNYELSMKVRFTQFLC